MGADSTVVRFDAPDPATVDECVARFKQSQHDIDIFGKSVREFFATHPSLTDGDPPLIHSVRYRVKSESHLREKIVRKKVEENRDINATNVFAQVTDLVGVRVLHLHSEQFAGIHREIDAQLTKKLWTSAEPPRAYSWDPEAQEFFAKFELPTEIKPTFYTSVHYVIRPNTSVEFCCEIQVRTLFEEVWGEIDHLLNYPKPTGSVACREQLRVLSKLVGAGSRLVDAVLRSHEEHEAARKAPVGGPGSS